MLNVYTAVPLETAEEIIAEFEKENPGLKGKIAIADPSRSGSSRYMTCCLLLNKKFGWGYFVKLYRNKCKLAQSNTALIKQIAAGEIYMGITLDYNVRKLLLDSPDAPVSCVFPAGGVVSMVSPIGLCEGCAHEDQAKRFINWVLSVKGQGFMSKKMGIMPLRDDVPLPEGVPATLGPPTSKRAVEKGCEIRFAEHAQGRNREKGVEKNECQQIYFHGRFGL